MCVLDVHVFFEWRFMWLKHFKPTTHKQIQYLFARFAFKHVSNTVCTVYHTRIYSVLPTPSSATENSSATVGVLSGDILVDDKPHVTGAQPTLWTHVLFDQPYNRALIAVEDQWFHRIFCQLVLALYHLMYQTTSCQCLEFWRNVAGFWYFTNSWVEALEVLADPVADFAKARLKAKLGCLPGRSGQRFCQPFFASSWIQSQKQSL